VSDSYGANARTVWTIPTEPYPEAHFATFPEALVEPCIKAGSREGDTVLDPFAGSGTTLAVARRLGRKAIGIELQPDYLPLIQKRVREAALPLMEAISDTA
jgi:site-specific DNA-methyltransferase (cytosine-N4-specific)